MPGVLATCGRNAGVGQSPSCSHHSRDRRHPPAGWNRQRLLIPGRSEEEQEGAPVTGLPPEGANPGEELVEVLASPRPPVTVGIASTRLSCTCTLREAALLGRIAVENARAESHHEGNSDVHKANILRLFKDSIAMNGKDGLRRCCRSTGT